MLRNSRSEFWCCPYGPKCCGLGDGRTKKERRRSIRARENRAWKRDQDN